MKKIRIAGLVLSFTLLSSMTSFAQGWKQQDGVWQYEKADDTIAIQEWVNDNGNWYYMDAQGTMVTGWFQDSGQVWYYFKADGMMASQEWIEDDGQSYYLNESGAWEQDAQADDSSDSDYGSDYVPGFNPVVDY